MIQKYYIYSNGTLMLTDTKYKTIYLSNTFPTKLDKIDPIKTYQSLMKSKIKGNNNCLIDSSSFKNSHFLKRYIALNI
jgi:hypothetical protein